MATNTAMIIGIVAVVIILGLIVWWLGSGCKRDNYGSQPAPAVAPKEIPPTPIPQDVGEVVKPTPAPQSNVLNSIPSSRQPMTVTQTANGMDLNNIKDEVGPVSTIVLPMQVVDTKASDQTLTQGNTHYILKGKKQRILLPYDGNGDASITEAFLVTQQSGGPSTILGANGQLPRPTPINVGQSFFIEIAKQSNGHLAYVIQQA